MAALPLLCPQGAQAQGVPIELARCQGSGPTAIAVDATHVYFGCDSNQTFVGTLNRVPKNGGPVETLSSIGFGTELVIDDTHVYWPIGCCQGLVEIVKIPKAGGTPVVLVDGESGNQLAVDNSSIYWTVQPLGLVRTAAIDGGSPSTLATGTFPIGIAVDEDFVYFTDEGTGTLMRVDKSGGVPTELHATAGGVNSIFDLAIDDSAAYWVEGRNGRIMKMPKSGGSAEVVASGQTPAPVFLALDAASVYWINRGDPSRSDGTIVRASKAGGSPETLASGQAYPHGIATDGHAVYWSNGVGGTVMKLTLDDNDPPVCDVAQASPQALWPPNHKMIQVGIGGVSDPNNDPVTITITAVTQDEPVNGLGDGDTSPDAILQGATAQVRAERAGTGNGRVYRVHFNADDGNGGVCSGALDVVVPPNLKPGTAAIDDGQQYDSTQP